jgi:hypothetical protein
MGKQFTLYIQLPTGQIINLKSMPILVSSLPEDKKELINFINSKETTNIYIEEKFHQSILTEIGKKTQVKSFNKDYKGWSIPIYLNCTIEKPIFLLIEKTDTKNKTQ